MLKSILCEYSDAHIPANGNVTVVGAETDSTTRVVDGNTN